MAKSNNGPDVVIQLTSEQARFLQDQIEQTQHALTMGLAFVHSGKDAKRETLEKIVNTIEAWKPVKEAVDKGIKS